MGEANFYYFTCLKQSRVGLKFLQSFIQTFKLYIMSALRSMRLLARSNINKNNCNVVARRNLHVDTEGKPGTFLPFNIHAHWLKSLAQFTVFIGSAFSVPFLMVRHQLKKKSGA